MRRAVLAAALALATPTAAVAQTPAPAAVDPARLQAARALIDLMMPPAQREAMMDGLLASIDQNMTAGLMNQPRLQEALAARPEAKAVLDRFLERQRASSRAQFRAAMPGMFDAMARAYARRFTTAQLAELNAFFATPTGRAYMAESLTIMNDPDIAAWQRDVMTKAMADLPQETQRLEAELAALERAK